MTTADAPSPEPAADTAANVEYTGTFQVLVSYYDAEDFKGDRAGADCPAVGVATDLRICGETLEPLAARWGYAEFAAGVESQIDIR